ncbi:hypothetical protein [Nonomuraea angiospora]|uniref:hypothetical protein n=1 Tax=Nonomuraea angiospora TaxID=46172 RepID=UPI0029A67D44|nr:hypothetical protein [Nonomuraea angiospora]MDX3101056.1 hypothetical protein [Nonomuraea angiospora]
MTRSLHESNIAALFALLDSTGDGQIAADDFKRIADKACAAVAPDPGSCQHQAIQQLCADWWERIREDADLDWPCIGGGTTSGSTSKIARRGWSASAAHARHLTEFVEFSGMYLTMITTISAPRE